MMAGRKQPPVPRWRERMALAQTPAEQFAAACDWLRASARNMERPQRDLTARAYDRDRSRQLLTAATEYVSGIAGAIDRGEHAYSSLVTRSD